MTTIYLAGRFDRGPELFEIAQDLEALGHTVTSRWLQRSLEPAEANASMTPQECAVEDLEDINKAAAVYLFTEQPDLPIYHSGGRHTELGYALAKGKRIGLVGKYRENVFHYLPGIEHFLSTEAFLEALRTP